MTGPGLLATTQRHHLLLFSLLITAFLLVSPAGAHPSSHNHSSVPCKAVPGTPEWPSLAAWTRLNVSTGGRLLRPAPPGAICHPGQPTYDAAACPGVLAGWSQYEFHAADPVSVDWQQYANDTCFPQPDYPCSDQGYPVFVINATTADHVRLGVEFAKRHNIRLIVKASGHDYIGRSVAPNSLSIWTRHIQGFQAHSTFSPHRCCGVMINQTAATLGAGTQMYEGYTQLDALNQTMVGGGGKTVGVGGYLTGGGHGLLSAQHGLGADQVLELEVVTPTGKIVIANECQNQDLFWAMRGGGGSTFGILTSVTIKTYPTPPLVSLDITIATTDVSNPAILPMVAYVLSQFPSLSDAGVSGYSYFSGAISNPFGGGGTFGGWTGTLVLLGTQDPDDILALFAPIFQAVNATWPDQFLILPNVTAFPSFLAWYDVHYDMSAGGLDQYVGSRLLDGPALTGNLTQSAELLGEFAAGAGAGTAYLVSGPGVHNAQPRGGGNAVCPAWRTSYIHATTGVIFQPLNLTLRAEQLQTVTDIVEPLRQLAPNTGAYVNEASPAEPDWQHTFWGDNYDRLVRIKRDLDPEDVLWCNPCVGNERWEEVGAQLCRVAT